MLCVYVCVWLLMGNARFNELLDLVNCNHFTKLFETALRLYPISRPFTTMKIILAIKLEIHTRRRPVKFFDLSHTSHTYIIHFSFHFVLCTVRNNFFTITNYFFRQHFFLSVFSVTQFGIPVFFSFLFRCCFLFTKEKGKISLIKLVRTNLRF